MVDVVWRDHYLIMAGMTSISVSLYESAMIDGATEGQMFWRITVPLLKPILIYIFVTSLVGGMQMFDIPYLLTDGRGLAQRFDSDQQHADVLEIQQQ